MSEEARHEMHLQPRPEAGPPEAAGEAGVLDELLAQLLDEEAGTRRAPLAPPSRWGTGNETPRRRVPETFELIQDSETDEVPDASPAHQAAVLERLAKSGWVVEAESPEVAPGPEIVTRVELPAEAIPRASTNEAPAVEQASPDAGPAAPGSSLAPPFLPLPTPSRERTIAGAAVNSIERLGEVRQPPAPQPAKFTVPEPSSAPAEAATANDPAAATATPAENQPSIRDVLAKYLRSRPSVQAAKPTPFANEEPLPVPPETAITTAIATATGAIEPEAAPPATPVDPPSAAPVVDAPPVSAVASAETLRPAGPTPTEPAPTGETPDPEATAALYRLIAALDQQTLRRPPELAPTPPRPRASASDADWLVFLMGGKRFGVPVLRTVETGRVPAITPVPNVPSFVKGLTNLRGEVVPVLDLNRLLGFASGEAPEPKRLVTVRGSDALGIASFLVDETAGLLRVSAGSIRPSRATNAASGLLSGVAEHREEPFWLLNVDKLFDMAELMRAAESREPAYGRRLDTEGL